MATSTTSERRFVYDQVCWVRISGRSPFYPARVVNDDDLNEKQMWKGTRPLCSVIFFDKPNIQDGSAFHVYCPSSIEMWPKGISRGYDKKKGIPAAAVQRAEQYRESQPPGIFKHEEKEESPEQSEDSTSKQSSEKKKNVKIIQRRSSTMPKERKHKRPKKVTIPFTSICAENCNESVIDGIDESSAVECESAENNVPELADDDIVHITHRTGFLGVNEFMEEIVTVLLAKTDTDICVVWDPDYGKCAKFARRISRSQNGTALAAKTVEEVHSNADVIFCCLEEQDLLQEHNAEGKHVILLEHLATISKSCSKNTVIASAFHPEAITILKEVTAKYMPMKMLGVGFCGCIGSAEHLFVSGDNVCYQQCVNYFIAMATNIIFTEGNAADALALGGVYNYLSLGFVRECYAARLFAQLYGIDIGKMQSALSDYSSMINLIFSECSNGERIRSLNRLLGTAPMCQLYNETARSAMCKIPRRSQDFVGFGFLNKVLRGNKNWSVAEAYENHFRHCD